MSIELMFIHAAGIITVCSIGLVIGAYWRNSFNVED